MATPDLSLPAENRKADPVVEYGRQIAWLSKEIFRLDEEIRDLHRDGRTAEEIRAERTFDLMTDRRDVLNTMVAEAQATSLEGAMVQVMVANITRDLARDHEGAREAEAHRMIDKLLYSIVGVLEAHTGVDRSEFGGEAYQPVRLDPFIAQQQEAA